MCDNEDLAFSGLGRHCANDVLHRLAIFPGTPSYVICEDDEKYNQLKQGIYNYLERFQRRAFIRDIVTTPNTLNPFEFNGNSNDKYISSYIDVFRRTSVRMNLSPSALSFINLY